MGGGGGGELTTKGREQADRAGVSLKAMLGDETVLWFVSPYTRTAQTFLGIIKAFGFSSSNLPKRLRMSPQLREQVSLRYAASL